MPLRAVFRFDINETIGGGHFIRCNRLANELVARGFEVTAALSRDETDIDAFQSMFGPHFAGIIKPLEAVHSVIARPDDGGVYDVAVFDSYHLDGSVRDRVEGDCRVLLRFSDWLQPMEDADIVLDMSSGATADAYAGCVSRSAIVLTGQRYALIAPEFVERRTETLARHAGSTKRDNLVVYVSYGLGDTTDLTVQALRALAMIESRIQHINIAVSSKTAESLRRHLQVDEPRDLPDIASKLSVFGNTHQVAALMATADIAMGGCGMTSWERCCLGLPTIAFPLSLDQTANAALLNDRQAIAPFDEDELRSNPVLALGQALEMLADNPSRRAKLSTNAAEIVDGKGVSRVADTVIRRLGAGS